MEIDGKWSRADFVLDLWLEVVFSIKYRHKNLFSGVDSCKLKVTTFSGNKNFEFALRKLCNSPSSWTDEEFRKNIRSLNEKFSNNVLNKFIDSESSVVTEIIWQPIQMQDDRYVHLNRVKNYLFVNCEH